MDNEVKLARFIEDERSYLVSSGAFICRIVFDAKDNEWRILEYTPFKLTKVVK